ncbi:MAG TPA: SpoIIE family protein phosphatase [Planctomycetota bacterium]|nr:SpoIIE family protein phosphatase [Planctomycetota bacterium]
MAQPVKKKTTGTLPRGAPQTPSGGASRPDDATVSADPVTHESMLDGGDGDDDTRMQAPATGRAPAPSTGAGRRPSSGAPPAGLRPRAGATSRQTPLSGGGGDDADRTRASKRQSARGPGQGGMLSLRGLPLALKFSIPISLLVILTIAVFGYVSIHTTETRLTEEIVKAGYDQVESLLPFAQKVMADFHGEKDEKVLAQKQADNQSALNRILEHDPRIYDIAIFATSGTPDPNPAGKVLQGREATQFARPPREGLSVNLPNPDKEVLVYRGAYRTKNAGIEQTAAVLYFRVPIREGPNDKDPDHFFSTLNLILSAQEIDDEVRALKYKLLLLGLVLTLSAVGVALLLARYTVKPIKALVNDMNEVAAGRLDHQSPVALTSGDEVGLLASAFNQMTSSLQAGRDSERENQRIAGELNTAKAIHIKLMPEKLPQLPGIDIFTAYQSAKEVGGDYYDFIPVGDTEHLALCVADVSGKGIPGSMVMGTTRTILRMMAVGNLSPADVLAKTNYHVARDIKRGMFVTCVYCVLNVRTHEMAVASAGHNPMLVFRAATGTVDKIRPNGIALGFDKGPVFNRTIREERVKLSSGDRVVLYTDGVVEAMNEERVEWSEEALDAFTLAHAHLPSKEYVRLLIKALDDHKGAAEQHDDITITTFRIV